MYSPSSSTTSLVSDPTVTSRVPLKGVPPKDFQTVFADLQTNYGFGGAAPCPVPKNTSTPAPRSTVSPTHTPLHTSHKNLESAFADLQSTYGSGGAVPSPIPKPQTQKNASGSLLSFFRSLKSTSKAETTPETKDCVPFRTPKETVVGWGPFIVLSLTSFGLLAPPAAAHHPMVGAGHASLYLYDPARLP